MKALFGQALGFLGGIKVYLIVGAVCLAIGAAGGWKTRGAFCDADKAKQMAAANASLQAYIAKMQLEAMANSAAIAAAEKVRAEQAQTIKYYKELIANVTPAQDCEPDPSLQPLGDGLR